MQFQMDLCTAAELRHKQAKIEAMEQCEVEHTQRLAIEEELAIKSTILDAAQQHALEMRLQKQYLEGSLLQTDGVIGEMQTNVEQAEGYIGKQAETIGKKEYVHRVWSASHSIQVERIYDGDDEKPPCYHVSRRLRKSMPRTIRDLKKKHPLSTTVLKVPRLPNPVNLFIRLKASGILNFKGNYFTSKVGEAEMVRTLWELCEVVKSE